MAGKGTNDLSAATETAEQTVQRQSDTLIAVIENVVKRVIAEELGDVWQKLDAIDQELVETEDRVDERFGELDFATEDYVDDLYDELTDRLDNASLNI